jgi:hypothetical protein
VLVSLAGEWGVSVLDREYEAVLLKALVVHSASWDGATEALQEVGVDDPYSMFGYGAIHPERVLTCTDQRTTLLGWGQLGDGEAHIHALPLPVPLHGVTGWRRLTVTLAWLSPVHPNHQRYRGASLWFDPYGQARDQDHSRLLGIRREGAHWQTVRRGTVQHEVFEGDNAVPIGADEWLSIQVNCASDAGKLAEPVPYGLAVTLEVAEDIGIAIYEEIAARVRPAVRVAPVETPL